MTRIVPALALFAALAAGCAAEIGDDCGYDIDCSPSMDRTCDRGQPGGYCLIIGCDPDECPGEAVCVEFTTPCPEGTEDEVCQQIEPNRGRTYCLRHCKSEGGCRKRYTCADPEDLFATIIDLDPNGSKVCVPDV